jgi:hypothetical protein
VLTAGNMPLWLSGGRKVLDYVWSGLSAPNGSSLVIQLHGSVAELGWGGFQMIAMPALIAKTQVLLERDGKGAIQLLASLQRSGKLTEKEVDLVWKRKLEEWVCERLNEWDGEVDSVSSLLPFLLTFLANPRFFSPAEGARRYFVTHSSSLFQSFRTSDSAHQPHLPILHLCFETNAKLC